MGKVWGVRPFCLLFFAHSLLQPNHSSTLFHLTKIRQKGFLWLLMHVADLTHSWYKVIIAWVIHDAYFVLIFVMLYLKFFYRSCFRNFTLKGSYSGKVFKIFFLEQLTVGFNVTFLKIISFLSVSSLLTFARETFAGSKTRKFYGIYFRECHFSKISRGFILANEIFEKFL